MAVDVLSKCSISKFAIIEDGVTCAYGSRYNIFVTKKMIFCTVP
jgi:hypothetical protein